MANRVFVGGFRGLDLTEDDLREKFEPYGDIKSITGMSRGFCFIEFDSLQDAQEAVLQETNNCVIKDKKLTVQLSQGGRAGGDGEQVSQEPIKSYRTAPSQRNDESLEGAKVFIGGYRGIDLTEEEVRDRFERYGSIRGINLKNGFCFVEYSSPAEAELAVSNESGNLVLEGKKLTVKISEPPKSEAKPASAKRLPAPPLKNRGSNRVFIGGYKDIKVSEEEIRFKFERYGPIEDVTATKRGYCFVQFVHKEDAEQAVRNEADNYVIQGKNITVELAKPANEANKEDNWSSAESWLTPRTEYASPPTPPGEPKQAAEDGPSSSGRLFIGGYRGSDLNEDDLRRQFDQYGSIAEVTPMERGFCFIQFEEPESAVQALRAETDNCFLKGKKITVQPAKGSREGGAVNKLKPEATKEWNSLVIPDLTWGDMKEEEPGWNKPIKLHQNKPKPQDIIPRNSNMEDRTKPRKWQNMNPTERRNASRVFVGGFRNKDLTDNDFYDHFSPFGNIQDVTIHTDKGYGFIQFSNPDEAEEAVDNLHDRLLKRVKLTVQITKSSKSSSDVRSEDKSEESPWKSGRQDFGRGGERGRGREDFGRGRGREDFGRGRGREDFGRGRDREDFGRVRGREDFGRGRGREDFRSGKQDVPEIWAGKRLGEQQEMGNKKMKTADARNENPDVNDCEIIVISADARIMAEHVEKQLKSAGMKVDLLFPHETNAVDFILVELKDRGVSYGVVLSKRSILTDTAEFSMLQEETAEVRVLPIQKILLALKEDFAKKSAGGFPRNTSMGAMAHKAPLPGANQTPLPGALPAPFSNKPPHPDEIQALLSFVVANRDISIAEYDTLLDYLLVQRNSVAKKLSAPIRGSVEKPNAAPQSSGFVIPDRNEGDSASKQQELQKRIKEFLRTSVPNAGGPKPAQNQTAALVQKLMRGKPQ